MNRNDKKKVFFKKHRKICELMFDKELEFERSRSLLGKLLVAFARVDLGYSDRAQHWQIFKSLHSTWHIEKKKEPALD